MTIGHCLECLADQPPCQRSDGACGCKVDYVDIQVHAARRYCPDPAGSRYGTADPPEGWEELPRVPVDAAAVYERPPSLPVIPRDQWPLAARIIAKLATAEDEGVGDTIARIIDPLGGDLFKRWYKRITGQDCGCSDRQGRLNEMYSYAAECTQPT